MVCYAIAESWFLSQLASCHDLTHWLQGGGIFYSLDEAWTGYIQSQRLPVLAVHGPLASHPTCARPCFERPCFETDPSIRLVPNRSLSILLNPASFTGNLNCLNSSERSSFRVSAFPWQCLDLNHHNVVLWASKGRVLFQNSNNAVVWTRTMLCLSTWVKSCFWKRPKSEFGPEHCPVLN